MKKKRLIKQKTYYPLVDFINIILFIYSHLPDKRAGCYFWSFSRKIRASNGDFSGAEKRIESAGDEKNFGFEFVTCK